MIRNNLFFNFHIFNGGNLFINKEETPNTTLKILIERMLCMSEKRKIYADDILGKYVEVKVDRQLGTYHPDNKFIFYPVNYGYIENVIAGDGEEQDAYILGIDEKVKTFKGRVIAVIHRLNDVEDKWVVAPNGMIFKEIDIMNKVRFQERSKSVV